MYLCVKNCDCRVFFIQIDFEFAEKKNPVLIVKTTAKHRKKPCSFYPPSNAHSSHVCGMPLLRAASP